MEVTVYEVNPECYPRFKNADKRICDITDRTNKLLLDTYGDSNLDRKTVQKRNICHNVKLYLCNMEEDKMNLNVDNFVIKNGSSTTKQTHKYRNAGQFLTGNKNSFDSTTVLVFQACKDLGHELQKFLPPGPSVIIVICLKEGQDAEYQYDHLNCKTVSSEENIAEVIGSLLEQMAFKPMKEMFETVRSLCYENHRNSSDATEPDRSEPQQMLDTNGSLCNEGKLETNNTVLHNKKGKLQTSTKKGTCTTSRQEVNAKLSSSTNDSHNKKRKLPRSNEKETCTTSRQEVNAKLSSSTNDSHNKKRKLQASTETGTCTSSSDDIRKLNGLVREGNEIEENEIAKREVSKLSSSTNDSHNEKRKLQACTETGTCASSSDDSRKLNECFNSDEKSNRKFRESKKDFQRLLGEMIGMYRRSRLPETLKPHLDGPWGKVSDQVISSLYRLSPSVRGYSYKFITRLQIHVFCNDIEKLRPKIAEILNNHGIKSDSYDVVPPLDDVKQFSKILSGSRVEVDESKHFGSLTSFVKMTPKTQKTKTYCSLASKHLLQGQKTLDILTKERTLKADVIEKTAPLGDLNMLFDIAAARIKKEDELHCDGRFKTENGTLMKGKMNKDDSIDCLHVHMYGAETPFSRGIIATTQYINIHSSVNGEESQPEAVEDDINEVNRFIYVQSRDKTKPFCKQGDSGAMVCADHEEGNHVELISSVIGGPLIVKNKDGKGMITDSYQTLRLRSGVDYLEKLTQSDIEFFDS